LHKTHSNWNFGLLPWWPWIILDKNSKPRISLLEQGIQNKQKININIYLCKIKQSENKSVELESILTNSNIGCSFKFILKVDVKVSIVNAPRITDHGSAV
jgi:hypothetical protein